MESNLFDFTRYLLDAEYSRQGSPLCLSVKYVDKEGLFVGFTPPLGDCLNHAGLKDPGFGSGPVEFSEISYIVVHSKSIRLGELPSYTERYELLKKMTIGLPGVEIGGDSITVTNINVFHD